jgi:hypothetical protein
MAAEAKVGHKAHRTQDHGTIRRWAEERGGKPSMVEGTQILRIDFGEREASLKPVAWDAFFEVFDDRGLDFLYQDKTEDGKQSRFFKFVESGAEDED